MGFATRIRKHTTVEFLASGRVSKQLSRGNLIRELWVKLTGAPTLAKANNTAAKTLRGDGMAIVKKLEIVANGTDVLRSFTGLELFQYNRFLYKEWPRSCKSTVNQQLGDTAVDNPAFEYNLAIPFWSVGMLRPTDTMLDTRFLQDLRAEVEWGTYTAINGDASAWTTTPQLEVRAYECFPTDSMVLQLGGTKVSRIVAQPSAANTEFTVQIPLGPLYTGFLINMTEATGATDTATIITNVKIRSGSTIFFDGDVETIRSVMAHTKGIPNPFEIGAVATSPGLIKNKLVSTAFLDSCWLWIDLIRDGYMTESIDSRGLAELTMELNVAGAGQIVIIPLALFPNAGNAAA